MSIDSVMKSIRDNDVRYIDLRFTDILGKEMHFTVPVECFDEDSFEFGHPFDGSSIAGWRGIESSDMILRPDPHSFRLDPFAKEKTAVFVCDILDPATECEYDRAPRSIAKKAENYLKSTGIGDTANFGPEPEFFVFDAVRWNHQAGSSFFEILCGEAEWPSALEVANGHLGYRMAAKGGYAPIAPADTLSEIRSEMCTLIARQGVPVEIHHHETGASGQCEIGTRFSTLVERADWNQIVKATVKNVAVLHNKTATFMPKPVEGDNGSGMHVHQSIWKDGKNLFDGIGYGNLSDMALYYIGGVIKHAKALNAITNPTLSSYKRLVPGFEAPVKLAYSSRNRSASIRIPYTTSAKARRIEVRFPDPMCNPYLGFSALLLAGLDGIQNKIHPGEAMDKNLYDLPKEEQKNVPTVAASLDEALNALDSDRQFLVTTGVFSNDFIDSYIELKMKEVDRGRQAVSPLDFELYYAL